jgi:hypothetical protein
MFKVSRVILIHSLLLSFTLQLLPLFTYLDNNNLSGQQVTRTIRPANKQHIQYLNTNICCR